MQGRERGGCSRLTPTPTCPTSMQHVNSALTASVFSKAKRTPSTKVGEAAAASLNAWLPGSTPSQADRVWPNTLHPGWHCGRGDAAMPRLATWSRRASQAAHTTRAVHPGAPVEEREAAPIVEWWARSVTAVFNPLHGKYHGYLGSRQVDNTGLRSMAARVWRLSWAGAMAVVVPPPLLLPCARGDKPTVMPARFF